MSTRLVGWLLAFALMAPAAPWRIVSTAPSATELLFALGLGSRVVGVTTFCHYPAEAQKLPKVGNYLQFNLETIASLKPDLVVVLQNPTRIAAQVRALHIPVIELGHETVPEILKSILQLGAATGANTAAAKLESSMRLRLNEIRARTAKLPRRSMMFIVGRDPGALSGMVAVGKGSYLNEMIELAGGVNVFHEAPAAYPKVGLEEVIARNPDVIVDMGDMAETVGVTEEHKRSVAQLWRRAATVSAVKGNRVFAVASDIYVVPGPRMVDAAVAFARMLHPEAGL
jgi:iron complex transport system substrate-binding protein